MERTNFVEKTQTRECNEHTLTDYFSGAGKKCRWQPCTCASKTIVISILEFHLDNVLKVRPTECTEHWWMVRASLVNSN